MERPGGVYSVPYGMLEINGAPFSYRNNKLIFMNKNMLRFVKWLLRAYHRYCNGVNMGVFASIYKFGTNNSTCETAAVHIYV